MNSKPSRALLYTGAFMILAAIPLLVFEVFVAAVPLGVVGMTLLLCFADPAPSNGRSTTGYFSLDAFDGGSGE